MGLKKVKITHIPDTIWVTTDGSLTGGGGYVSQGDDPNNVNVVGFWSGKWNSAQQNYPVHESLGADPHLPSGYIKNKLRTIE